MNAYRFVEMPSNSSVASFVTLLVSGWFLVAAGAILSDPASPYTTQRSQTPASVARSVEVATPVAIAPQARTTITVVARRIAPITGATTL